MRVKALPTNAAVDMVPARRQQRSFRMVYATRATPNCLEANPGDGVPGE